ncbi:MAG: topoisomerase C-terminal repeat-containing protein [Saprospiraceae bacterium]
MEANRGYVTKESREGVERPYQILTLKDDKITQKTAVETTGTTKNVLYPSDMGMIVSDFLSQHFTKIMDYGFTADIEKRFDDIAEGKLQWNNMIEGFYQTFHQTVETTLKEAERADGERILGKDPESGRTVLVRMSSLGRPVVQIGKAEELLPDEKPRYANLRQGSTLETVNLEEALEGFQLPKTLGQFEGEDVLVNTGRYGPYVKYNNQFISLGKGEDPFDVSLNRAIELIKAKLRPTSPLGILKANLSPKGKGRFGPFVKWEDLYVNIPRKYNFDTINEAQACELIQAKIEKEANRYIHRWPEENISVENGRWGPFIRFGKASVKLPKVDDAKMTSEQARGLDLEQVKAIIEAEIPGAFTKKPAKKTAAKTAKKK